MLIAHPHQRWRGFGEKGVDPAAERRVLALILGGRCWLTRHTPPIRPPSSRRGGELRDRLDELAETEGDKDTQTEPELRRRRRKAHLVHSRTRLYLDAWRVDQKRFWTQPCISLQIAKVEQPEPQRRSFDGEPIPTPAEAFLQGRAGVDTRSSPTGAA